MKQMLLILLLVSYQEYTSSKKCTRPTTISRRSVHVYRPAKNIMTTVYNCHYNQLNRIIYNDITQNCISAFTTGTFTDKWEDETLVNSTGSKVKLTSYQATVNTAKNEIILRSGTVCQYDRGFCYDAKESTDYGVLWDVVDEQVDLGVDDLEQLFFGHVDIWTLDPLEFLFYSDTGSDQAFSMQLLDRNKSYEGTFWNTKEGYIVSEYQLGQKVQITKTLDEQFFPLKPKQLVTDNLMKKCDLQLHTNDFSKRLTPTFVQDPDNLAIVLNYYNKELAVSKKRPNIPISIVNDVKELDEKIKDEDTKLDTLSRNMDESDKRLSNHNQVILKLKEEVTTLSNYWATIGEQKLKRMLDNRVDGISKKCDNQLQDFKTDLDSVSDFQIKVKTTTNKLETKVTDLEGQTKEVKNGIQQLRKNVEDNTFDIDNIRELIEQCDTTVHQEVAKVKTELSNRYESLNYNVQKLAVTAGLKTVGQKSIDEDFEELKSDVFAKGKNLEQLSKNMQALAGNSTSFGQQLTNIKQELDSRLGQCDASISKLQTVVNTKVVTMNAGKDVADLKLIIADFRKDLSDKSNEIETLKYECKASKDKTTKNSNNNAQGCNQCDSKLSDRLQAHDIQIMRLTYRMTKKDEEVKQLMSDLTQQANNCEIKINEKMATMNKFVEQFKDEQSSKGMNGDDESSDRVVEVEKRIQELEKVLNLRVDNCVKEIDIRNQVKEKQIQWLTEKLNAVKIEHRAEVEKLDRRIEDLANQITSNPSEY